MNNPQDAAFAASTPEAPPAPGAPIQGRPVGGGTGEGAGGNGISHEEVPAAPVAPRKPKRRSFLLTYLSLVAGSRWLLAIPAIALAIYGGKIIEDARVSPNRPVDPPLLGWQLMGLAGLLLAV